MYVVFGATGGIGSELCKRLGSQSGATVVMVGRDEAKLQALKGQVAAQNTAVYTADVTDASQVTQELGPCMQLSLHVDNLVLAWTQQHACMCVKNSRKVCVRGEIACCEP